MIHNCDKFKTRKMYLTYSDKKNVKLMQKNE